MTHNVKSHTDTTKSYTVTITATRCACNCPDHVYRKRECKHIREAKAYEKSQNAAEFADIMGQLANRTSYSTIC